MMLNDVDRVGRLSVVTIGSAEEMSSHPQLTTERSSVVDFVDYVVQCLDVSIDKLRSLSAEPAFVVSLAAYREWPPLGYVAWYCWPAIKVRYPDISETELINCLRAAAYTTNLLETDARRIAINPTRARRSAPNLFAFEAVPVGGERARLRESYLRDIEQFAVDYGARVDAFATIRASDEDAYLDYWISRSSNQIEFYLSDPRFLAGMDAFSEGCLSYHGLLSRYFDSETYHGAISNNGYSIFNDIAPELGARVLSRISKSGNLGALIDARSLRHKFPEMYDASDPEGSGIQ
jgi:hypothetical protein